MAKQTRLEKALIRMARAAGEVQRALAEMKEAIGKGQKPETLIFCEKCESPMNKMPLERTSDRATQYKCPKCGEERWI